jgi:hypothetical protein
MNSNLSKFNSIFYRSQLEEILMDVDDAILSVNLLIDVQKRIPLVANVRANLGSLALPVKIHPAELRSSYFYFTDENGTHPAQVRDVPDSSPPDYEGTGVVKTFDLDTGEVLDPFVGTVDYGTGLIVLNSASPLTISGYLGNTTQLIVYAGVQESVGDVFPGFNEIIVIDDLTADPIANVSNGITINVVAVNN